MTEKKDQNQIFSRAQLFLVNLDMHYFPYRLRLVDRKLKALLIVIRNPTGTCKMHRHILSRLILMFILL